MTNNIAFDYLTGRKISLQTINKLNKSGMLKTKGTDLLVTMFDFKGNETWKKIRRTQPKENESKSINQKWSTMWYFYDTDITDTSKKVLIFDGEIDYLSAYPLQEKLDCIVIWLATQSKLTELIGFLLQKKHKQIYICWDNDEACNKSLDKIISNLDFDLHYIYDARDYLESAECKDFNDWIVNNKLQDFKLDDCQSLHCVNIMKAESWMVSARYKECFNDKMNIIPSIAAQAITAMYSISSHNTYTYVYDYSTEIYNLVDESDLKKLIRDTLKKYLNVTRPTKALINEIKDVIHISTHNKKLDLSISTTHGNFLNMKEGQFNIDTGETTPYHTTNFATFKHRYSIESLQWEAPCPPLWDKFLHEIFTWYKDIEWIIAFLQEYIGLTLVPITKFSKAIIVYGTGSNGKWVLLDTILAVMGNDLVVPISLSDINKDTERILLLNKLLLVDFDMDNNFNLDKGIIKKIVSWEPISVRNMYKTPITIVAKSRIIAATNKLPYLTNSDNSIRRRFFIIELKKSFLKEEADPDLKQKLEWEHEDIFAWAVKWLARLLIRWNFEEQPELTANLESYLKEQDTVALFIEDDSVNLWDGYKCPVRELYEWYRSFCKDSGRSPLNLSNFKTNLKAKWIVNTRSANKRYYLGIEYISPNSSYSSWWN